LKHDPEDSNKVIHLNKICDAFQEKGEFGKGLVYGKEAIGLAEKINYKDGLAGAYNELGIGYRNFGDYPRALENFLIALKIREGSGNKPGIARILGNIGIIYRNQGEYEKALSYYLKAHTIFLEINNKVKIARNLGNIAIVYNNLGNYEKAMEYYFRALKISEEDGDKAGISRQTGNIGTAYQELADEALAQHDLLKSDSLYKKALAFDLKALAIDEELDDKAGMAIWLGNIGAMYMRMTQYAKARLYLKRALSLSDSINDLYGKMDANRYLSELFERTGEKKLALTHYKLAIAQKDSLFNEERDKEMTRKEMNYEFEKKEAATKLEQEKKEAIAAAEARRQRIILLAISGFGLLVLGFAIFAYRSFMQKQKANVEITRQKHLIEEKQKEILDSIYYARRIQRSLLPTWKYLERHLERLKK